MEGWLSRIIQEFLEKHGIDPGYACTVVSILIALSYRNHFKNWDEIEGWRKGLAGTAVLGAIVFSIVSLLRLVGVMNIGD